MIRTKLFPWILIAAAIGCDTDLRDNVTTTDGTLGRDVSSPDSIGADTKVSSAETDPQVSAASQISEAICVLVPVGASEVSGTVRFSQQGTKVKISGEVRGLTPGKHGFHVHEFGDLSDREKGESAGGHFSPGGHQHGRPTDTERHVGDLGNIEADADGVAKIAMEDTVLRLTGPHSILGRGLVVHANEDVFTQPTGDAGGRVSFGVIGVAKQ